MSTRILERYELFPGEQQDIDIDFKSYLDYQVDTVASISVQADDGITVDHYELIDDFIKVWLTATTTLGNFLVRGIVTTTGGRVHQGVIKVKVNT